VWCVPGVAKWHHGRGSVFHHVTRFGCTLHFFCFVMTPHVLTPDPALSPAGLHHALAAVSVRTARQVLFAFVCDCFDVCSNILPRFEVFMSEIDVTESCSTHFGVHQGAGYDHTLPSCTATLRSGSPRPPHPQGAHACVVYIVTTSCNVCVCVHNTGTSRPSVRGTGAAFRPFVGGMAQQPCGCKPLLTRSVSVPCVCMRDERVVGVFLVGVAQ